MTHHVKTIEEGRCCDMCTDPATVEIGTGKYCGKHHDMVVRSMEEVYIPKREPKRNRNKKSSQFS